MTTSFTKNLIDIAMGCKSPDQVSRKGTWISVQSGEFVPATEIAIEDRHVAHDGSDASHTIKVAHFKFIPVVVDPDEQEKT